MESDTQSRKIEQLQILEQNIQNTLMQKQQLQSQTLELETAINELGKANGKTYKIIGAIMFESKKEDLKSDLTEKKQILDLRLKTVEKQEIDLKEKASKLQKDVLSNIKSEGE